MTMMGRAKYHIILCDFVGFILTTIRMKVAMMILELMIIHEDRGDGDFTITEHAEKARQIVLYIGVRARTSCTSVRT